MESAFALPHAARERTADLQAQQRVTPSRPAPPPSPAPGSAHPGRQNPTGASRAGQHHPGQRPPLSHLRAPPGPLTRSSGCGRRLPAGDAARVTPARRHVTPLRSQVAARAWRRLGGCRAQERREGAGAMLVPSGNGRGFAPAARPALGAAAAPARPPPQTQRGNPPSPPTPARARREAPSSSYGGSNHFAITTALTGSGVPGGKNRVHQHRSRENTSYCVLKTCTENYPGQTRLRDSTRWTEHGVQPSKVGRRSVSIIFYSSLDCSFECSYYKISCHGPQTYGTSGKLSTYSKEHKLVFPFKELWNNTILIFKAK